MIKDLIQNLSAKGRSLIKSVEIAKLNHVGTFDDAKYGIRVEIQSLKAIEVNGSHGVEIMARAWKGGKPLGFGKDGSVEIERFRIFNPPILVDDITGDIVKTSTDSLTVVVTTRKLKEDLIEAIRQSLSHTIKVVGKENTDVVIGKVGNTTSTFFPDAAGVDGWAASNGANLTWANIRAASGDAADTTANPTWLAVVGSDAGANWRYMYRGLQIFDTSALPDTDTIDSATISGFGTTKQDQLNVTPAVGVVQGTTASSTALANADYGSNVNNTTRFATDITYANFSTTAYNDWALNASGLAAISKTGVSKFCFRTAGDIDNVEYTLTASSISGFNINYSEEAGTTKDPKLVVVHSVAAVGGLSRRMMTGIGA